MFKDELSLITDAEQNAEALRKSARTEAKRMQEEAEAKAAQMAVEAETEAKKRFDALVREGQQIADMQYEAALKEAACRGAEMEGAAAAAEADAVNRIIERIVKSSVNY